MATYAIYSYEVQEGDRSLLYQDTKEKAIAHANEIVAGILKSGFKVLGKKNKKDQVLKCPLEGTHNNVFVLTLCNDVEVIKYDGHKQLPPEYSHPGSYIIIDNREGVCQIAIEKNFAFDSDTDKIAKFLKPSLNECLKYYGLKVELKQKYRAETFEKRVMERVAKGDCVNKVVWEFHNLDKVSGVDAPEDVLEQLSALKFLMEGMKAVKGKLTLQGGNMNIDTDTVKQLGMILGLCAQNGYNISYHFNKSSTITYKEAVHATCFIENVIIDEFKGNSKVIGNGKEPTYNLILQLDNIRKEIANYKNEKIVEE